MNCTLRKLFRYRNSTVDIFLKKQGDEDLPEIYVTRRELKKYAESLFACEAGCIMKLEQLGSSETKFPIFLTSPPTPILYISHLKEHLELLQHTLHVRESLSHQEHYEKHYNKVGFRFDHPNTLTSCSQTVCENSKSHLRTSGGALESDF